MFRARGDHAGGGDRTTQHEKGAARYRKNRPRDGQHRVDEEEPDVMVQDEAGEEMGAVANDWCDLIDRRE